MADLKSIVAETGKILNAPTEPTDIARKADLDEAVAGHPTTEQMTDAIAAVTHPPVSISESAKTTFSTVIDQVLLVEVKPVDDSEIQAAASGLHVTQSVAGAATVTDLGKLKVLNVAVIRRLLSDHSTVNTGVDGVDYFIDGEAGMISYAVDSNLLNDTESPQVTEVYITFDCPQIKDGSGMLATDDGLENNFGSAHHQVARGDHIHANDHLPATGDEDSLSILVVVNPYQKITASLKLSPTQGGVSIYSDGVGADWDAVARAVHIHDLVTNTTPGFMSPGMLNALISASENQSISVLDTTTITLDKTDGVITAQAILGAGLIIDNGIAVDFDEVAAKGITDDHEIRIGALETALTADEQIIDAHTTSIYNLESQLAADEVTIDAHTTDIYNLQIQLANDEAIIDAHTTEIYNLEQTILSLYGPDNPPPIVTDSNDGMMTSEMLGDLDCLALLLQKEAYAHSFMPMIRLESANLDVGGGGVASCPLSISAHNIIVGGRTDKTFTVDLDINGVAELKDIVGGTVVSNTGGRVVKDGTPAVDNFNVWILTISDDGTGTEVKYYLNSKADTDANHSPVILAYSIRVTIKGGATISLETLSGDSLQATHTLAVPGVPPYPSIYLGNFIQIDPVEIVGECSLADIISGGSVNGIIVLGASSGRDGRDGTRGLDGSNGNNGIVGLNGSNGAPGWNGHDGTDGTGKPGGNGLDSTNNPPFIDISRDLTRLTLIDLGGANGWVQDIHLDGNDVWVSGSFTRFGSHDSWSLARLDKDLRYAYDFTSLRAGFSNPIRWISEDGDGGMFLASISPGFYQNQNSWQVHKIGRDGQLDTGFTCPVQISTNDADHPNDVIGMCALTSGKIAVLTPRTLTVLNTDGTIFSQNNGSNDAFLSITAAPDGKILLSSHAWSDLNVPQGYGSLLTPRGFKLLAEGDASYDLDASWANPATAGTGAMSSCGKSLVAEDESYFLVGNALSRYNSINTSWNATLLGNLAYYSEDLSQAPWTANGSTSQTRNTTNLPAGVGHWCVISDTDGLTQAYYSQDVAVDSGSVNTVTSLYIQKRSSNTTFPVIELLLKNGTQEVNAYVYFNPVTGAFQLVDVIGSGTPQITVEDIDAHTWRVSFTLSNNNTGNDTLAVSIYPAYSSVMGGTSSSETGSITVSGIQVRYDGWETTYVFTGATNQIPPILTTNSDQFRGMYKILADGSPDPDFAINLTYFAGSEGMAIPFAIDKLGRIYFGGPVSGIEKTDTTMQTVTRWMLYRITADGKFDKAFELFNDDVLTMRLNECGNLIVGGKFTHYGAMPCGRLIELDPDGVPVQQTFEDDLPVLIGMETPDVDAHPCYKKKAWLDTNFDPPTLKTYNGGLHAWLAVPLGSVPQLQPVIISPTPDDQEFPFDVTLSNDVIGVSIWFTIDGSDPKSALSTRALYSGPVSLTDPAIVKAFAVKTGFGDSDTSSAVYGTQLPTPIITPDSGNIDYPHDITIAMPVDSPEPDHLWYTTDGSNPVTSPSRVDYLIAGVPFSIDSSIVKIRAFAEKATYIASESTEVVYGALFLPGVTFDPANGTNTPITGVTLALADISLPYTIYYTLDNSDPTDTGNPSRLNYTTTGPFDLTSPTTVRAYGVKVGWVDGPSRSVQYGQALPAVTFTPGDESPVQDGIALECPGHEDATIYYTLDGSSPRNMDGTPSGSAIAYNPSDMLNLSVATLVKAFATLTDWLPSATSQAYYFDNVPVWLANMNFTRLGQPVKHGGMATANLILDDQWNENFGVKLDGSPNSEANSNARVPGTDTGVLIDSSGNPLPLFVNIIDGINPDDIIEFSGTVADLEATSGETGKLYRCSGDGHWMMCVGGTNYHDVGDEGAVTRAIELISVGDNAYRTSMKVVTAQRYVDDNSANPLETVYALKITFKGVPRGFYDLYAYGHSIQNANWLKCSLLVDGSETATKQTSSGLPAVWRNTNWVENSQYVKFSGFEVFGTDYSGNTFDLLIYPTTKTSITVLGFTWATVVAFLNAVQLRKLNTPPRLNSVVIDPEDERNIPVTCRMTHGDGDSDGVKIYYTIGATSGIADPTESDTRYTGEFDITSITNPPDDFPDGVYIKAKAFLAGFTPSHVTLKHFQVEAGSE